MQVLVSENCTDGDIIIYTEELVVHHLRSAWDFTTQCSGRVGNEESSAFAVITSSLTMEVMAMIVAKVLN
uniref:Uncharacterized protein n=1 Tax=Arion vulgaris TaxID=1028688 RepID=A0A0B7AEC6_9EUPU